MLRFPSDVRSFTLLLLIASALSVGVASAAEVLTRVAGTGVRIAAPPGFVASHQFPGFEHAPSGSTIMVAEIPGPYSEIVRGQSAENLATRGMALVSAETIEIAGHEGRLAEVTQPAHGIVYRKWIGLFGTDQATVMVAAMFPNEVAASMSDPLKAAVLSATWETQAEVDTWEGLPFRLEESASLKVANRMADMLIFSKGGRPGPLGAADPQLIAGAAIAPVRIDDLESFAKARVANVATVGEVTGIEGESLKVGPYDAYELTADATHSESGTPLKIYQLMLVRGTTYFLAQGLVERSEAPTMVPEFRSVARSIRFVN